MNVWLAVLWKDLVTEWRSRDRVVAMALFAVLVVVIFHFAVPNPSTATLAELAPGFLWIAYLFASLLGLNRAFALELENDALSGLALAPVDRGWIFLGKASANFVLLGLVQLLAALVFAVTFTLDLTPVVWPLAGIVALASLSICAVGTLFGAVAVRTRYREVMLPLLLLPLLMPVLIGAVTATAGLMAGGGVPGPALRLLTVTAGVYLIISFVTFEFVLDE